MQAFVSCHWMKRVKQLSHIRRVSGLIALAILFTTGCSAAQFLPKSSNPVVSHGEPTLVVMDLTNPFSLDRLPAGWAHVKFLTIAPMKLDFVTKAGVAALRCETNNGGSLLGRWTDVELSTYPKLRWRWFVERSITSNNDERTSAGDDHPIRFYLEFEDTQGKPHSGEIIWGNTRLKRGDWKVMEGIAHFVADAGQENMGQWRDEEADLVEIYRKTSHLTDTPKLKKIALFCDSDNTHSGSVAYLGGPVALGNR